MTQRALRSGELLTLWGGTVRTVKASGAETGGAYSALAYPGSSGCGLGAAQAPQRGRGAVPHGGMNDLRDER